MAIQPLSRRGFLKFLAAAGGAAVVAPSILEALKPRPTVFLPPRRFTWSNYEVLNVAPDEILTAAEYTWQQLASDPPNVILVQDEIAAAFSAALRGMVPAMVENVTLNNRLYHRIRQDLERDELQAKRENLARRNRELFGISLEIDPRVEPGAFWLRKPVA